MYSAISESSEFVHANLPRAGFELGSLGSQASVVPIESPFLVILKVSKVFNQVLTFFISFFQFGRDLSFSDDSSSLHHLHHIAQSSGSPPGKLQKARPFVIIFKVHYCLYVLY